MASNFIEIIKIENGYNVVRYTNDGSTTTYCKTLAKVNKLIKATFQPAPPAQVQPI